MLFSQAVFEVFQRSIFYLRFLYTSWFESQKDLIFLKLCSINCKTSKTSCRLEQQGFIDPSLLTSRYFSRFTSPAFDILRRRPSIISHVPRMARWVILRSMWPSFASKWKNAHKFLSDGKHPSHSDLSKCRFHILTGCSLRSIPTSINICMKWTVAHYERIFRRNESVPADLLKTT